MVQLRALGPLEASNAAEPIRLGGPKQRTILALLIAAGGRTVPDDVLIDAVWGDATVAGTKRTLQTYVSNLRRALGDQTVVRAADGYRLELDRDAVDVWRFEDRVARPSGPSSPEEVAERLSGALSLWRGRPYSGTEPSPKLDEEVRRLEELRLAATEDLLEAELEAGDSSAVAAQLEQLTAEHPTRERLRALHMLALYRSGRQTEALDVYRRTHEHLSREAGLEPGPDLQRLHALMLQQDESLELGPVERASSVATGPAPPSGIVTFLFTDIEGSTRLFHDLAERYAEVLEQQRTILRAAWREHGGYEAFVEGDGFLVAFGSAIDAVHASVEGQRALAAASWPADADVRVRMGMHTGLASPRGRDYISLAIHQAARVAAAAHGGQVLVSEQTVERLGLLEDIEVHPRGRFRLRGFDHPMRLYELRSEGLATDLGPLRATPADSHNLVRPPTEMIGREPLLDEVGALLEPGRLVTLTGPGGVGKTRVASEVGIRAASDWEDGVWFTDLAPVTDPELVAAAVADAVGAPKGRGGDRSDDLLEHLATRSCVVILDNCEHVAVTCREFLDRVFAACRGVAVLATSREPLHAPGELLRPVEPLDVPPDEDVTATEARATSSCRLLELRGARVRPGFAITEDNAGDVAAICRQLDGLPLLIELAATLLPLRSPSELRADLSDQSQPLQSRDPLAEGRHRTVDELIGWSYDLLSPDERAAFRRLSVFGASFSLDTACAAVAVRGLDDFDTPRLVWSLVERSLVTADLAANETRYRLLGTIRRYGRDRLEQEDEATAVALSLSGTLLSKVGPWLPTDWRWVGEVAVEIDNLRALLPLLPDHAAERAQEIVCSIGRYHDATQSFREGIRELRRYSETFVAASATRVAMLARLADLYLRTGAVDDAEEVVHEAEDLRKVHGAPDWDDVAVDRARGEIARRAGDLEGAAAIARASLERDLSERGRSRMYNLLGTTLAALGDLEGARSAFEEELELTRRIGYDPGLGAAHGNLAETSLRLGDAAQAAHHQRRCLELALAQGSPAMVAFSLIVAARLAGGRDDWRAAATLHARAEVLLEETGLTLYDDDQRESDRLMADAHGALGSAGFQDAMDVGRRLPVANAAQLADELFREMEPEAHIDISDGGVGAHI